MITNGPKYGPGSNPGRFWHGRKTLQKNDLPKMLQKRRRKIFGIILLAFFFLRNTFFSSREFFFLSRGGFFHPGDPRTPLGLRFLGPFLGHILPRWTVSMIRHISLYFCTFFYIFKGTLAAMTRGRSARSVAVARSSVAIGASQLVVRLVGRGRSVGRGRLQPRGSRPVGSFGDDQV